MFKIALTVLTATLVSLSAVKAHAQTCKPSANQMVKVITPGAAYEVADSGGTPHKCIVERQTDLSAKASSLGLKAVYLCIDENKVPLIIYEQECFVGHAGSLKALNAALGSMRDDLKKKALEE